MKPFITKDLDGNEVDDSIFENHKLTMVNIWMTTCGPCLNEMPELGELAQEYEEKGVQIVGIVIDVPRSADGVYDEEKLAEAKELTVQTDADYLHLLPSKDLETVKLRDVYSVPETVFVDENGKLVGESYVGARSGEEWKEIIDSML